MIQRYDFWPEQTQGAKDPALKTEENGRFVLYADLLAALAEKDREIEAAYERGIDDGQTKQAILELRGRDLFMTKTIKPQIDDLRAKLAAAGKAIKAIESLVTWAQEWRFPFTIEVKEDDRE